MRTDVLLAPLVAGIAAAVALSVAIAVTPGLVAAEAGSPVAASVTGCDCATSSSSSAEPAVPVPRPDPRARLDGNDRIAALEALQLALSEVGDGASYVWHARTGRVSGVVRPTQSFKDPAGRICRHIMVLLSAGHVSRKTEGVACRLPTGIWQLEG